MRERPLGRAVQFEKTQGDTRTDVIGDERAECEEAPRPAELVFEIGVALAGFLSVALVANLAVVILRVG